MPGSPNNNCKISNLSGVSRIKTSRYPTLIENATFGVRFYYKGFNFSDNICSSLQTFITIVTSEFSYYMPMGSEVIVEDRQDNFSENNAENLVLIKRTK